MWYLLADGGGEYRFFRADRMEGVEVRELQFRRLAGELAELAVGESRPFTFPVGEKLIVRFAPPVARWVAEREGGRPEQDSSYLAEYPLGDRDWAVRFALQYGAAAEVVGPGELRVLLAERLARLAASTRLAR
jgi:predicted DNA-binding transcriptional regulator YafY